MIGPIFLSALMMLACVLCWNANKMQSVVYNSADFGEVLHSSTFGSELGCSKPPPETTLAFQQSLGFFDDINDQEWLELFQKPARMLTTMRIPTTPIMIRTELPFGTL